MKHPGEIEVVVVGAGAAGLAAARALAEGGKKVVILEARSRIGGRIHTQRVPARDADPLPVELGAEFVHGLPQSTCKLLQEANLQTQELDGSRLYFDAGKLTSARRVENDPSKVLEDLITWFMMQPEGTDETFAEYLVRAHIGGAAAQRACAYVEGFNAADRNRIGIAALVRQQQAEDAIDADRLFHVCAGYGALPAYLLDRIRAAGGQLLLDHQVQRIDWAAHTVQLSGTGPAGANFKLTAKQCVITVPLGVLQAALQFSPEPAEALQAASRLAFGHVLRTSLLFDAKYWPEDLSFLYAPQEPLPTWWTPMPNPAPLITAWAGGTRACELMRRLDSANLPAALAEQALEALSRIVEVPKARLKAALISHHCHDWTRDPHCRGAYSYAPAGALEASSILSTPIGDTLFFAGEHTDVTGHWGTVHGALGTGQRAAQQLQMAHL
jgi:monoamine oxidase